MPPRRPSGPAPRPRDREAPPVFRRDGRPNDVPRGRPAPPPRRPGPREDRGQAWGQSPPPRYAPPPRQGPPPGRGAPPPRRDVPPPGSTRVYERPPRRTPPPPPPPARRDRGADGRGPRRPRRFGWGKRIGLAALVMVLALAGFTVYLDRSMTRIDALAPYEGRIGDTPGTNWLLVGSDSRTGMSPEEEQALATGGDTGPSRTDTIMLIHVPRGSGPTTMVSLPRDSYVPIPGYGREKLNAAFAFGGPQLLTETVETVTGVRIDHYAEIGFGGFAGMVDAVGGVEMCLDQPIADPLAGIDLQAGCQTLDGAQALGFVRTRATAMADVDRMRNQRAFMSAMLSEATSPATFLNPFRALPLASGVADSLTVDSGDHLWHLARLAWALRGDVVTTTVPVAGFENTNVGNVVMWDTSRASEFFDAIASGRPVPEGLLTEG
ncbi:LytR family transcriptional regulator [Rhodococcus rhodnii]|nr:LytR family transcriptional regulator [Rhodococcus rhodnii]